MTFFFVFVTIQALNKILKKLKKKNWPSWLIVLAVFGIYLAQFLQI